MRRKRKCGAKQVLFAVVLFVTWRTSASSSVSQRRRRDHGTEVADFVRQRAAEGAAKEKGQTRDDEVVLQRLRAAPRRAVEEEEEEEDDDDPEKRTTQAAQSKKDREAVAREPSDGRTDDESPPTRRECVLFRTHSIDPLTLRIADSIHDSVAANREAEETPDAKKSTKYEVFIAYDADVLATTDVASALKWTLKFVPITLRGIMARYPAIQPRDDPIVKSHYQQLAFAYAYAVVGVRRFRYAWCVEHDAALTGGRWANFFDAHASRNEALLAYQVGWTPKVDRVHGGGAWNGRMVWGPETARVSWEDVAFMFGPVVRVSDAFLRHVDAVARHPTRPTYGHAETALPTLCNATRAVPCALGNLSDAWIGQLSYRLPVDVNADVFAALEDLAPDKLFHPVRDTASASSATNVKHLSSSSSSAKMMTTAFTGGVVDDERRRRSNHARPPSRAARVAAQCLLANPRPVRPSYNSPIGLPHYLQRTCPVVNCVYGQPENHRYVHMAVAKCIDLCKRRPDGCPYSTAVEVLSTT